MSYYPQRVRDNILPLSVGATLPEAFEEWSFTDETYDHEGPVETCKLCDKTNVRYHFRIRNVFTDHELWVGSHCILQFELSVFEQGTKLSSKDASRKLARLKDKMRLDYCIKSLEILAEKEENSILTGALSYYKTNKLLTPKQACVVFWRLNANKIEHAPSFFKISLKKEKYKNDLKSMDRRNIIRLWPALSSAQKIMAEKMGHKPPQQNVI